MDKNRIKQILFVSLLTSIIFLNNIKYSKAQTEYRLIPQKSQVGIKGTSSVHDWVMSVTTFNCKLFITEFNNEIQSIDNGEFSCKVADIMSNEKLMNRKTHEAFSYNKYPYITFTLSSIENLELQKDGFNCTATGDLSMAGQTNTIDVDVKGKIDNDIINIVVIKKLDMTEWGMDPPTTGLGTIAAGKDITVVLNLYLTK